MEDQPSGLGDHWRYPTCFLIALELFFTDFLGFLFLNPRKTTENLHFRASPTDPECILLCQHMLLHMYPQGSIAMTTIKIRDIGNSLGVVLPKELIARLRVSKGDQLFVQETVDGLRLTAYDPEFQKQMEIAKMVMQEDRDALRALSK